MLKVHLNNGETLQYDLSAENDARRWLQHASDPAFQARITGLTVEHNGVSFSLPRPQGFSKLSLFAESLPANGRDKGGERVLVTADDLDLTIKAHRGQAAARVNLRRQYRPK